MSRMTKRNLNNIKTRFTQQTGVELPAPMKFSVRKLVVLAAAVITCFALTAFTYPLFSYLEEDELSIQGIYEGNGVVSVYVENRSDKDLEFQKQTKLMRWNTSKEVEPLEGKARFANTSFPAHSSGTMTIDLSEAYDIAALEKEGKGRPSYYLLLTNNGFLFGHDWICSVSFTDKEEPLSEEPTLRIPAQADTLDGIEETLRPYFQDTYYDEVFAWESTHFDYLQRVDEVIKRFNGTVVSPVYPTIMVSGPSTFLDPDPKVRTEGLEGTDFAWSIMDGYHRLVGASPSEKALAVTVDIPSSQYPGSSRSIPLRYLFVYDREAVRPEDNTFLYGRLLSFSELEDCKIFSDEHYVIFDATDYLYTDLDTYIDFIRDTHPDLLVDEPVRQHIHEAYGYYREEISGLIGYQKVVP